MKEIIVLIGAGSAMFTRGILADLIKQNKEIELRLVDIDKDILSIVEALSRKMIQAKNAPIKLDASTDRREMLRGATTVICTIGVGGRRAWEQDVFIPRKYGIYQPVGDSVMPGGTSRALRMIPPMVDIAKDVLDLAPDALFFNYGNPMSAVCRGVRKATGANMVGLCCGVNMIGNYLARILDAKNKNFQYTAVGINHLTWFTEIRVNGQDMIPSMYDIADLKIKNVIYEELGTKRVEEGTAREDEELDQPFSWHLFKLFGAFPAVYDAHVIEFFPQFFAQGKYFGKQVGDTCFIIEKTIARGDKIYNEMKEQALSKDPLPEDYFDHIGGEHEQVTEIIDSIRTDAGRIYSVNLPNKGQVPNLPLNAVIEANAIADAGGLKHIVQKPLTDGIAGILATKFAWVETIVEAALEGSREKFIQALILDGSVSSLDMATKMADELLAAQAEYLHQF